MKRIYVSFFIFSLFLIAFLFSCDESIVLSVDCGECKKTKPEEGEIEVLFTVNEQNKSVPFTLYMGNVENKQVVVRDTAIQSSYVYKVRLNNTYSVIAKYFSGKDTILCVDGTKIKTKKISGFCDDDCYIVQGKKLKPQLKY